MREEPVELTITLNPANVSAPLKRAAIVSAHAVHHFLGSTSSWTPELIRPARQFGYAVPRFTRDPAEYESTLINWALLSGLTEIARGARETLEEAYKFVTLAKHKSGPTTFGALDELMQSVQKTAEKLNFPDLISAVNNELNSPLNYDLHLLSLQAARNCLLHRGGIVKKKDAAPDGFLRFRFPRLRFFYLKNGEEIDILPELMIDDTTGRDVQILRRIETAEIYYSIGEPLIFDELQFTEIVMAADFIADDIESKLPAVGQPSGATAPVRSVMSP